MMNLRINNYTFFSWLIAAYLTSIIGFTYGLFIGSPYAATLQWFVISCSLLFCVGCIAYLCAGKNPTLKLAWPLLGLSIFIFSFHWLHKALSNFKLNFFDGAIDALPHFYISQKLIPYKDFGTIYTPGKFLLVGTFIPFHSIAQVNLIFSLITLLLVLYSAQLLLKISSTYAKAIIGISFYILFAITFITNIMLAGMLLLILLSTLYFTKKPRNTLFIFMQISIINFTGIFFRWDMIVTLLLVQTIVLFLLYAAIKLNVLKYRLNEGAYFLAYQYIGATIGFLALFLYLFCIGALKEGFDFIFKMPFIILPYRTLPLPHIHSLLDKNLILYISLISYTCALLYGLIKSIALKQWGYLFTLALPVALLPYALGRSDYSHFIPFYCLVGIMVISLYASGFLNSSTLLLIIALLFPIYWNAYSHHHRLYHGFFPNKAFHFKEMTSPQITDCKHKVKHLHYNSMFIGRTSYHRYVTGETGFYLINPNVPPATAFLNDESGLQNSCHYGNLIAQQLLRAKKPMLAILDTETPDVEPNKTASMTSCLKIEKFLTESPHTSIGSCHTGNTKFSIRLYTN